MIIKLNSLCIIVLSRVKMCFRDTVIRVEKFLNGSDVGIAMELHIKL